MTAILDFFLDFLGGRRERGPKAPSRAPQPSAGARRGAVGHPNLLAIQIEQQQTHVSESNKYSAISFRTTVFYSASVILIYNPSPYLIVIQVPALTYDIAEIATFVSYNWIESNYFAAIFCESILILTHTKMDLGLTKISVQLG